MSNSSILYAPHLLWDLYVEYLWNYKSGSWVNSIASTFRVLALFIIAPFIVLALLDVTSYIIARTLGVIDDTKASTTYSEPVAQQQPTQSSTQDGGPSTNTTPSILIQSESSETTSLYDSSTPPNSSKPPYFPSPMEEGNLKLSGVDMFSPAPSQPPSPTLSRWDLSLHMTHQVKPIVNISKERHLGRIQRPSESSQSSSGESSFAMLERESGTEDVDHNEGMHMRKRRVKEEQRRGT